MKRHQAAITRLVEEALNRPDVDVAAALQDDPRPDGPAEHPPAEDGAPDGLPQPIAARGRRPWMQPLRDRLRGAVGRGGLAVIRRLTLQNWRAYEHLELDFQPGATFVVAPNGVGKSSIVEGARFALFGSVPPARDGAARVSRTEATSASVEVELPSGRLLTVTRPYPVEAPGVGGAGRAARRRGPAARSALDALLVEEYGAEPSFLARLAMLHSSTVFAEARGLDLRDHLCRVFGVDGLMAALEQTKVLAAAAKKTVDSARKPAAAHARRGTRRAGRGRSPGRRADRSRRRRTGRRRAGPGRRPGGRRGPHTYETWKVAADRYAAVATEVAAEAAALTGRRPAGGSTAAARCGATLRTDAEIAPGRRRGGRAGRPGPTAARSIARRARGGRGRRRRGSGRGPPAAGRAGRPGRRYRAGLAELDTAEGSCPVCRRPLEAPDVEVARAGHERDLAALDAELAALDETGPVRLVTELRQLRHRLTNEPLPGEAPPRPTPTGRRCRRPRPWSASKRPWPPPPSGGPSWPRPAAAGRPASRPGWSSKR